MTLEQIRIALEDAIGIPEEAMREAAARETSVCPVFLALLRLPAANDDAGAETLEPKQRWEMIDSLGALVGAIERSESRAQ